MKKIYFLLSSFFFILHYAFGQGGTWTWISGDSAANSPGVFGTQGVPSVNNHPPGFYEPAEWKDKQGNFWIFGGTYPSNSDLWEYNPVTKEWTWVKGDGFPYDPPVYGTQGVPSAANTPGSRTYCAATWVDTSGNLWLFGGYTVSFPQPNDLWEYNISSNQWTWIAGDTLDPDGVHGTQGVASPLNTPGARNETSSAWTDSLNNLWLFGGQGIDDNGNSGDLNDLMVYNISANEWTWMKGSPFINAPVNYGTQGIADPGNDPGARYTYNKWKDMQGNFWLMGGADPNFTTLNDVWEYTLDLNEWIWMNGSIVTNDSGSYQSNCVFGGIINQPASRYEQRSAVTDSCGRFWLFGGVGPTVGTIGDGTLNDLWIFNPSSSGGQWNWIDGDNVGNEVGNYGTLGLASPSNMPPSRCGAVAWWGNDNRFYMFGGLQFESSGTNTLSDVWVFNPDTNCVPVCNAVAVIPPVADFQSSKDSLCANGCINFTDLSTHATSWRWFFAGALDSTSTAENPQYICYSKAGIYNVTLIASNAGGSDTVTFTNYITVNPAPSTPDITQHLNHDTLYCSTDPGYISYQWYSDSTLIPPPGGTDTFLVVSKSGNYNVEVKNVYGCSISVGINIVLGIQNYVNDNIISIYPNPATDELIIDGSWKIEDGRATLTIINVLGETIYTKELNSKPETVNCKPFSTGIYFVHVANEGGSWVGRFVKE